MRSKFLHRSGAQPEREGRVAIPFKWGQSFYKEGTRWRKVTWWVAIPFKWGQSFYYLWSGLRLLRNQSQSLLNEVKVSTTAFFVKIVSCCVKSQSLLNEVKVSTIKYRVIDLPDTSSQSLLNEVKVSTEQDEERWRGEGVCRNPF